MTNIEWKPNYSVERDGHKLRLWFPLLRLRRAPQLHVMFQIECLNTNKQSLIHLINSLSAKPLRMILRYVPSYFGQDTLAEGDYILTDQSRFALIEFKYTQAEIIAESKKDKRLKLCEKLELHMDMKVLHDKCHFIAWAEAPDMKAKCNIYRLEVCNQKIFGAACGLSSLSPSTGNRIFAKQFTTEFFSGIPPRSLSLSEFESYVVWLLQVVSGSSKSSFELLTYDETSDECAMIKLSSIRAAYDWMQKQQPQNVHGSRYGV